MPAPILLLLGAGSNVGLLSAAYFAVRGFRVAVVARSLLAEDYPSYLAMNADLGDLRSIKLIFERVRAELGEPNVVLYNGEHAFFSIFCLRWPSR